MVSHSEKIGKHCLFNCVVQGVPEAPTGAFEEGPIHVRGTFKLGSLGLVILQGEGG